ncbi:AraC family transcriptional regulator [Paenibacillus sp. MMS20-IR301]|uniref:AraC family transcriptional regulator n=1 Tax=Paenibacillus sp. MMS20-IR301 TaxID=2895946 RepID=UPI0028EFED10|nr:AraC family transcriptional regulator [Paenibacillus sp. MMS20-IR301]WNS40789.1 AraC family transcriptional regulator [Paenibacillus sp. MMS20-IR301]
MLAVNIGTLPRIKLMGFVSYKQPWLHFKRTTNEYVLYLVKSGELHLRENETHYVLKKGDLLVLEPNIEHTGTEKHICDYYYIHFEHPDIKSVQVEDMLTMARRLILEEEPQLTEGGSSICHFPKHCFLSKKVLSLSYHTMNEMLRLYRRKYFNRGLTALKFTEWLIEVSREHFIAALQEQEGSTTKPLIKVHALLDYIHEHYTDKITGSRIAQEFDCNYDYMNRVFTKLTGQSIMRYVNRVRINHAKELIEATHLPFGEIGYLTGLDDPYHFSKVFKKFVGVTPSEYYKEVQKQGKNLR